MSHSRTRGTGLFAETESRWSHAFRTVLAVRGDYYTFTVNHSTLQANDGDRNIGRRLAQEVSEVGFVGRRIENFGRTTCPEPGEI